MAYFYQVYGLKLQSDLELPELMPVSEQAVDVTITLDAVPRTLPSSRAFGSWADYDDRRCLLRIENVGCFLVEDGCSITVAPFAPTETKHGAVAPMSDVRLYLLGSALAALLHQRGLIPLHVSAVLAENGVWAFTGPSGAGKSTLAGWLSQCVGLPLISDDVSVVDARKGLVRLLPGPRKLKLWRDAVGFLDLDEDCLVQDLSNTPKFQLYLPDDVPGTEFELKGLVVLERAEPGEPARIIPVMGIDRFRCFCQAVYRHYMATWFRSRADYVRDVFQLAETVPVYRLRRPWSLEQLDQKVNPLWELLLHGETEEDTAK